MTQGVELVDILSATQLSASVRRALAQSTKSTAKKIKIKLEPIACETNNTMFLPPPEPLLHPPMLHININHTPQPLPFAVNSVHNSPTPLTFTTPNVESFSADEVKSPPKTPSAPMSTTLPTTVFQYLSPNPPSFHKQLPPPTTSIQQELFADQSVSFQSDSESDEELPIKSEPTSPARLVTISADIEHNKSTIQDTATTTFTITTLAESNSCTDSIIVPFGDQPAPPKVEIIERIISPTPPINDQLVVKSELVPTVFEIKAELPNHAAANFITSTTGTTIHMPQYGGVVKAATLSDLEGIDMMHLPVDLDDSGNIDILQEIDVGDIETTDHKAAELMQDTSSSFFTLIRDIFCSTLYHRTTIEHLNTKITSWLNNPITALNDWYNEADDWLVLIPSAIQFLVGEFLDQPEDFVPYVEYKPQLLIYQWIGAGRDSDQHLNPLCEYWLLRRNEMGSSNGSSQTGNTHATADATPRIAKISTSGSTEVEDGYGQNGPQQAERQSSPLPPRCPTVWTVAKANEQQIEEFREQERKRFEHPHLSFTYRLHGFESVVGPVKGIYTQIPVLTKARDHNMLTVDRPNFVTILTLVRDATARLPNGEGTRSDICELLRSSQYINPDAADNVMQTIVSGALDRMHTEHDPCVRYDPKRKIWVYLHRSRSEEEFEKMHQQFQGVSKHRKQSHRKLKGKSLIKSPIVATGLRPSNSVSPVTSKGATLLTSVLPAPTIVMLAPVTAETTLPISTNVKIAPSISTSFVTVHSPQPQLTTTTTPPLEPLTHHPTLQVSVQPIVAAPTPILHMQAINSIKSPVQQPVQKPLLQQSQPIVKQAAMKKPFAKPDNSPFKPLNSMVHIEKPEHAGLTETTQDGQPIPIMIGKAKLAPAPSQPVMAHQVVAQRIFHANLDNKTVQPKKPTRVIVPNSTVLTTTSVQQQPTTQQTTHPNAIPQQIQRIQQVASPTIKITQQPAQLIANSMHSALIKPSFSAALAPTVSLATPKPSAIKTTLIQPTMTTMSIPIQQQPQQSILIQSQTNRVQTPMFVPNSTITTNTKKIIKPTPSIHQPQSQPQSSNQNFVIPINISAQSILQNHKLTNTLANHQVTHQALKPVVRPPTVPVLGSPKPGMSLLQTQQPSKPVIRASSISSGKSLINPTVAAANMSFQQHQQQLHAQKTIVPANIVSIQGRPAVPQSSGPTTPIPKLLSTSATNKGQSTTLTPAQQRLILQNIIAQQKQQRANAAGHSVNLLPSTVLVSTPNPLHPQTHIKNVIVSQSNNTTGLIQRIIASSATTSMIMTAPTSQQSTITTLASTGPTAKPTTATNLVNASSANSLINRQLIQIHQNNVQTPQPQHQPSANPTFSKVQTVSTSNLTPQQQQSLLQSIKQQQMRVQNQQANATPQQQTLMVKQQQVLQQIQKQLQHQQNNTINQGNTSLLNQSTGTIISSIPSSASVAAAPATSNSTTANAPQSVTRIIRPGLIRQQPFIQTATPSALTSTTTSAVPATMTKVLSNNTGQIISLESLLQKQGQSLGAGTTLRVAGTKPGQTNIIQLAGASGSSMPQYAIVSQGPQGRSMISLTSTPQRLVNAQGVASVTSASASFGGTTLLKTMADGNIRSTSTNSNAAPHSQQPKLVQQPTKVMAIQGAASGATRVRPNATAIRMMNTSNLNIAHIAGKPVIIASKPNGPTQQQQTSQPASRQNVIWQSSTPSPSNTANKLINSTVSHNNDQQPMTSRVAASPQAVMFGNQVVKLQSNTITVNQPQAAAQLQQHQKPLLQATNTGSSSLARASFVTQSGATRTVVLGQTGQTIRVHSPAQTGQHLRVRSPAQSGQTMRVHTPAQTGTATTNHSVQNVATVSMPSQHVAIGPGIKVYQSANLQKLM